jgi:hypothetical protein
MKRCKVCGAESSLLHYAMPNSNEASYSVSCDNKFEFCVIGPRRRTPEEAEAEWDKLMGGETLTCETVRKPVGVFSATRTYAICNDGTIWECVGSGWFQMLPIPGTEADR